MPHTNCIFSFNFSNKMWGLLHGITHMMHAATHTNLIFFAFIYQEFEMQLHGSYQCNRKKTRLYRGKKETFTMASSKFLAVVHIISLLHFLSSLLPIALSQTVGKLPPDPSIAECGPYLLPLAPCGPFVQGTVPFPALQCCINLRELYSQQASCLCLLMNGSTLSSFPINTTLALQLPTLCTMQIDASICSGI